MRRRTPIIGIVVVVLGAWIAVELVRRGGETPSVAPAPATPPTETNPAGAASPAPLPAPAPAPPPRNANASKGSRDGESASMQTLRDLGGSNPELTLKLAREGRDKYKDSPDAAERAWFIVRSLMNLGRVDEARAEARVLLDTYPRSSWAEDVHRHLFVNPPTDPAERGYGKATELGPGP
jgi:hypothetical protein